MTAQVIGAIHWQALRLWLKGAPVCGELLILAECTEEVLLLPSAMTFSRRPAYSERASSSTRVFTPGND